MEMVGANRYDFKMNQYRVSRDHVLRSVLITDCDSETVLAAKPEHSIPSAQLNEEQKDLFNICKLMNQDDHIYKFHLWNWCFIS